MSLLHVWDLCLVFRGYETAGLRNEDVSSG